MHITQEFYTGPFCNGPRNPTDEEAFDIHPNNVAFLNPAYPYLNQFLENVADTGICFGISLWKIELEPSSIANFSTENVHALITSGTLLQYQLWAANGRQGLIEEQQTADNEALVSVFARGLHELQVHGENRVLVSRQFCAGLAQGFLNTLEATSGKINQLFHIRYGWADWFALDSHYDFGYLLVTDRAIWLLTFSESD